MHKILSFHLAVFTLTPKLWIDQTKAIGIVSKQGKNGGTFAHPMIACEFASWIAPEFKIQLLRLSLDKTKIAMSEYRVGLQFHIEFAEEC